MPLTTHSARTYDRTWDEIERMLDEAERVQNGWVRTYHDARNLNDRETMKEAARNKKALEGVVKTLRWVLGEEGVDHPLH